MTKSIHNAMEDLKLHKTFVVSPGSSSYKIEKDVEVLSVHDLSVLAGRV